MLKACWNLKEMSFQLFLQVSAAADRPAGRSVSCPPCCTQMSTVSVINWWPRPSPVYHTDRPPKLTAPGSISRLRDMVGAHQYLNGLRDLTTPLSGVVCHPWASTCYRQFLSTKFEVWIELDCRRHLAALIITHFVLIFHLLIWLVPLGLFSVARFLYRHARHVYACCCPLSPMSYLLRNCVFSYVTCTENRRRYMP